MIQTSMKQTVKCYLGEHSLGMALARSSCILYQLHPQVGCSGVSKSLTCAY